ncbi:MAG TPA: protoporphyrinogen oxidase [Candidatus Krumholzibacteria bacterium]
MTMPEQDRSRVRNAPRVVIVGGGISGLSTAWYLEQAARTHGLDIHYTLVEAAPRWGGKLCTDVVDSGEAQPFVVEAGPDAFITMKPWALELARELGLAEHLIPINPDVSAIYVLDRGRPVPMPEGVLLMVPTRFKPFVLSRLFSPAAKLRMGLDLVIPPRRDDGDETLANFVRRRLGSEALDKIAEPLMSGIYNADAEAMSIMATFPRFRELEKKHGSLIRGMLASRPAKRGLAPGAPASTAAFMSLRGGVQELSDALVPRLTGDLRHGTRITETRALPDGGYALTTDRGDTLHADAVVLTTAAYTAADLVRDLAPGVADMLASIRYLSTGTVTLAYRASDITKPIDGLGLVVPKAENRPINAITIASTKFSHRAPKGTALLRVFFGGTRSPASMEYDDNRLLAAVRDELRDILGIHAVPIFHRIYRWPRANPQYDVNHLERVSRIEADLPRGLYVTGGAYRGVGMPDCVYQAKCTVERVIEQIEETSASLRKAKP